MTPEDLERALKRAGPVVGDDHRQRLEDGLLRRYDAAFPRPRATATRAVTRYATAAAVVATLVTATQVPAEYHVEVGKRVSVVLPRPEADGPDIARRIASAVAGARGGAHEVQLSLRREPDGPTVLVVDVWGDQLEPDAEIPAKVRQAVPEVAALPVEVTALRGNVRDTLLGKVRHRLFRRGLSPEERARARQQVLEELRAREGADAEIEVDEDRGEVRVKVRKLREAP